MPPQSCSTICKSFFLDTSGQKPTQKGVALTVTLIALGAITAVVGTLAALAFHQQLPLDVFNPLGCLSYGGHALAAVGFSSLVIGFTCVSMIRNKEAKKTAVATESVSTKEEKIQPEISYHKEQDLAFLAQYIPPNYFICIAGTGENCRVIVRDQKKVSERKFPSVQAIGKTIGEAKQIFLSQLEKYKKAAYIISSLLENNHGALIAPGLFCVNSQKQISIVTELGANHEIKIPDLVRFLPPETEIDANVIDILNPGDVYLYQSQGKFILCEVKEEKNTVSIDRREVQKVEDFYDLPPQFYLITIPEQFFRIQVQNSMGSCLQEGEMIETPWRKVFLQSNILEIALKNSKITDKCVVTTFSDYLERTTPAFTSLIYLMSHEKNEFCIVREGKSKGYSVCFTDNGKFNKQQVLEEANLSKLFEDYQSLGFEFVYPFEWDMRLQSIYPVINKLSPHEFTRLSEFAAAGCSGVGGDGKKIHIFLKDSKPNGVNVEVLWGELQNRENV